MSDPSGCWTLPTSLKLFCLFFLVFFDCLFASRWCCNLFALHRQGNFTTYALLVSHRHVPRTNKRNTKKFSLVPELMQMFVEISGDFLVFFLQEKKKQSFFTRWAWGVLQLPLLVLLLFFSHRWVGTDNVFHCSCLLLLLRGCWWAQSWGFYCCGTWWVGWLGQISQQAWMVGGIIDVSKSSTNIFICKWTEQRARWISWG